MLTTFKLMCVLCASLLLFSSIVHCQDDDDDDDDDDHGHGALDEDSSNNYINGFDDMSSGSGNIDELSGGMFDSDSESDPMDFMDSKRRQSFVRRNFPFFFRRRKNDEEESIIQNNPGSYIKQDGQEQISQGGNIQQFGDDGSIHSTGGGNGGSDEGGCSGGCDDDHDHHHHDHHDHHGHHDHHHDHHRHGSRGGHRHGYDDHHRHGSHHDHHNDHHRQDHDHHEEEPHREGHHGGPHDHDNNQHDHDHDHLDHFGHNRKIKHLNDHESILTHQGLAERMQRSTFGDDRLSHPLIHDPFDPEKRSRYHGYDHKQHSLDKAFSTPFHPLVVDPFHQFEQSLSALSSDPHNAFPRGSFYGMDGFYGNSRLVRDKLLSPYALKTTSRKMPCDSGCGGGDDDDRKKKKR